MRLSKLFLFLIFLSPSFGIEIFAQTNGSYQVANRLFQQQRYEEALPILTSIHRQEPQIFEFLNLLVECHLQLKQYNIAEDFIKKSLQNGVNVGFTNILLGELYYIEGDTTKAFSVWENNLRLSSKNMSLYFNTAKSMTKFKEFDRAVEVLLVGRKKLGNDDLFLMDVPNIYMQAGKYPEALAQWLTNIEKNTRLATIFKRTLIRYNDPLLYEDSIAEIEFKLREISINDKKYSTFFDLQNWLLFENKLYKRAFSAALKYEKSTTDFNFKLEEIGYQLLDNKQFDLALQAFSFYRNSAHLEKKMMVYDNIANVYAQWAKHLQDYNLSSNSEIHQLYSKSLALLDTLIESHSNYRNIGDVYLRKAELSFDELYDLNSAREAVDLFNSEPYTKGTAQAHYLQGRILLAENEYLKARIEFTRSNRLAGTGELAEKTRYFLALADFYSGDYEFAKIQLKTLSRKNTSFYANEALKLRLWLQEGTTIDTTGKQIQIFADGIKQLNTNPIEFDDDFFLDFLDTYPNTMFKDDILVAVAIQFDQLSPRFMSYLNEFLDSNSLSPLRENLLWLRATKSEYLSQTSTPNSMIDRTITNSDCIPSANCENIKLVPTARELYEALIMEFPNGFYAPYARKKLIELPL